MKGFTEYNSRLAVFISWMKILFIPSNLTSKFPTEISTSLPPVMAVATKSMYCNNWRAVIILIISTSYAIVDSMALPEPLLLLIWCSSISACLQIVPFKTLSSNQVVTANYNSLSDLMHCNSHSDVMHSRPPFIVPSCLIMEPQSQPEFSATPIPRSSISQAGVNWMN